MSLVFADLGSMPPSNALVSGRQLELPEASYPLRVSVCEHCWLVQTQDFAGASELFTDEYPYFSSVSSSWLDHCKAYVDVMVDRFNLNDTSLVAEIASNDGYLLQFVKQHGIPCFGVEPTAGTASAGRARGVEVVQEFFSEALAGELMAADRQADLVIANNVLAHVPDLNDFARGVARLLKPGGVATFEFPYLCELIEKVQFDTIYHEHYSYFSFTAANNVLKANGLETFEVEKLKTHGGSLRVYAQRAQAGTQPVGANVTKLLESETDAGVATCDYYLGFQLQAEEVARRFFEYVDRCRHHGLTVAGYGAAAKGTVLLNFSGVGNELMPFIVDRNPAKQGRFTPGSHIPIVDEVILKRERPDRVVILPWNLRREIAHQLGYIADWNALFVVATPELEEFSPSEHAKII